MNSSGTIGWKNKLSLQTSVLTVLLLLAHPPAATSSESDSDKVNTPGKLSADQKEAVVEWFKKYDQIRRDAELTLAEKFQTMSFLDKNLDGKTALRKRDQELVARMNAKYAKADEAMKNLQPVSEVKELQEGYSNYFRQVHHVFTRYVKDSTGCDANTPHSTVQEQRSALEELDSKNKKLDAQLRSKYGIAKHKHS